MTEADVSDILMGIKKEAISNMSAEDIAQIIYEKEFTLAEVEKIHEALRKHIKRLAQ